MEKCKTATNSHLNVAFEIFSSLPTKGVRSQGHRRVRIYKKKIDFRRLGKKVHVHTIKFTKLHICHIAAHCVQY